MIPERVPSAAPSLRLHSDLPDSLSTARTPLDVLTALAQEGQAHDFDLWAMAVLRDQRPVVYMCSVAPLPGPFLGQQLKDFVESANALSHGEDPAAVDWSAAPRQVICLEPELATVEREMGAFRDFRLAAGSEGEAIIRVAGLKHEDGHEPAWSRLEMMLQYAVPHLRSLDLNSTDTMRGMIDAESGAYSWPYFLDALEREVERARRQQCELSMAVLELRPVRKAKELTPDLHRRVAEHVTATVRNTDLVGRIGASSYGIFFHNTGPRPALIAAGRIADALRGDENISEMLSFSLGVSGWERTGLLEVSTLLAQAGEAAAEAAIIAPDRAFVYL
jgi:GGDEF domain-containing protein